MSLELCLVADATGQHRRPFSRVSVMPSNSLPARSLSSPPTVSRYARVAIDPSIAREAHPRREAMDRHWMIAFTQQPEDVCARDGLRAANWRQAGSSTLSQALVPHGVERKEQRRRYLASGQVGGENANPGHLRLARCIEDLAAAGAGCLLELVATRAKSAGVLPVSPSSAIDSAAARRVVCASSTRPRRARTCASNTSGHRGAASQPRPGRGAPRTRASSSASGSSPSAQNAPERCGRISPPSQLQAAPSSPTMAFAFSACVLADAACLDRPL